VALAMLVSQSVGLAATAMVLLIAVEVVPAVDALLWGAAAGVAGITGLAFFYRALSGGRMALIAPIAGVIGAALPAAVAVLGGEQLNPLRMVGLGVGLVAIGLISFETGARHQARLSRADLALALVAGLGFAGFFLFLDRASTPGATWWPLFMVRLVGLSVLCAAIVVIALRRHGSVGQRLAAVLGLLRLRLEVGNRGVLLVLPAFVLAGTGDLGGNLFFVLANQKDALSVAVVLSSLYPVVTAVLAALLLGERLSRPQAVGVGLAALAAGMIGVG
jgi:drug/metabolite transporter (DMT)-like permease